MTGGAAAGSGGTPHVDLTLSLVSARHASVVRASRALVIGCGRGAECRALAGSLPSARVVGVDLARDFDEIPEERVHLLTSDAALLPFGTASFDLVYTYHALEHVAAGPEPVLAEAARVLRPGGVFFCGVPNRLRCVAYIDSAAPLRDRIAWNLKDWNDRLRGRFRNERGAHAGFSERELGALLSRHFLDVRRVRADYFAQKYSGAAVLVRALERAGLGAVLFPCNYFICGGPRR